MSSAMTSATDLAQITRDAHIRKYECIGTIVESTAEVARHRIREAAERGEGNVTLFDFHQYKLLVDYSMDQRYKIRQGCTTWWCNTMCRCSSCTTQVENLDILIQKVKNLSEDDDGKFAWIKYLNQHLMIDNLRLTWSFNNYGTNPRLVAEWC